MPDVVDLAIQKDEFGDVLLDELEIGVAAQMDDVIDRPGDEIVDADHFMAAGQEEIGQMGAEEAGGTGDDGGGLAFFHSECLVNVGWFRFPSWKEYKSPSAIQWFNDQNLGTVFGCIRCQPMSAIHCS